MVDGFLRTRPYFVRERDFRRSRAKKRSEVRAFAALYTDFAAYVYHWNHDPAPGGGPSRADLLKQGPSYFLTPPAPENLAIFAMSNRSELRDPRRDGDAWFMLDTQGYEPYRRDKALYKQFADLSSRGAKIDVKVFDFGVKAQDHIVLFSLDGQRTWELAVPAGSGEFSGRRHTELLIEVEQELAREDAASLDAFFQKIILGSTKGPLVLDGLARERRFYHHAPAEPELPSGQSLTQSDEQSSRSEPAEQKPPSDGETIPLVGEPTSAEHAPAQIPNRSSRVSRKIGRSRHSKRTSTSAHQPGFNQPGGPAAERGENSGPGSDHPSSRPKAPNIIEQLLKRRQQGGA